MFPDINGQKSLRHAMGVSTMAVLVIFELMAVQDDACPAASELATPAANGNSVKTAAVSSLLKRFFFKHRHISFACQ
jgi:hypothetical protein